MKNLTDKSAPSALFPPQSINAEQGVLGAIIRNGGECLTDVLEVFGNRENIFYDRSHQKIFNTCLFLYKKDIPIDRISVAEHLRTQNTLEEIGNEEYILDLVESSMLTVNVTYYATLLKDKAIFRELIKIGNNIVELGYEEQELEDTIDKAQSDIFNLSQDRDSRELTPISVISDPVWQQIEKRSESTNPLLGLDTGFNDLNNITLGLQPSDFIVIAARPSMGKTAFCLNIAETIGVRQEKSVAVFSLEMSKEQLMQRLIASNSGIDSQKLRTGKNLSDEDWDRMSLSLARLSEAPIYIDDTPVMSVMDIRSKARRLKSRNKDLGLIIIDYLQLMKGNNPNNRVQELSEISRGLKTLARELEVPVIGLSQLSRSVESRQNKRPMLSDLRESGAIEQDADLVFFLYRHEYYEPEDVDSKGICEVIIAKQRNGPTGTVKLHFHGATTRFNNLQL